MTDSDPLQTDHPGLSVRLLGRVTIEATLTCQSGLHIGSGDSVLQIGGVDKVVIKDPADGNPYVPFSSLRGRMRALLEAAEGLPANRRGGEGVYRHECDDANEAVACPVCRIFGSTSDTGAQLNFPSRLRGADHFVSSPTGVKTPSDYVELKSENALDRLSAHANPRVLERVRRGTAFDVAFHLDLKQIGRADDSRVFVGGTTPWADPAVLSERFAQDVRHLLDALALVEATALGGNSSRGYGAVAFSGVTASIASLDALRGRAGSTPKTVLAGSDSARQAAADLDDQTLLTAFEALIPSPPSGSSAGPAA